MTDPKAPSAQVIDLFEALKNALIEKPKRKPRVKPEKEETSPTQTPTDGEAES